MYLEMLMTHRESPQVHRTIHRVHIISVHRCQKSPQLYFHYLTAGLIHQRAIQVPRVVPQPAAYHPRHYFHYRSASLTHQQAIQVPRIVPQRIPQRQHGLLQVCAVAYHLQQHALSARGMLKRMRARYAQTAEPSNVCEPKYSSFIQKSCHKSRV